MSIKAIYVVEEILIDHEMRGNEDNDVNPDNPMHYAERRITLVVSSRSEHVESLMEKHGSPSMPPELETGMELRLEEVG